MDWADTAVREVYFSVLKKGRDTGGLGDLFSVMAALLREEREACAQIAEDRDTMEHSDIGSGIGMACRDIAEAIRNRSR